MIRAAFLDLFQKGKYFFVNFVIRQKRGNELLKKEAKMRINIFELDYSHLNNLISLYLYIFQYFIFHYQTKTRQWAFEKRSTNENRDFWIGLPHLNSLH